MKTRSILYSLFFAATLLAFVASCSGNKNEEETESHESQEGHDEAERASDSTPAEQASEPQFP